MKLVKRKEIDPEIIEKLSLECGIDKTVCEILVMREIDTKEKILNFLNVDIEHLTSVFDYSGMRAAGDRILQAVSGDEKIVIYGDYDCDGVCATSILYMFLSSLNLEVYYYIPSRKAEGYGINREAIEFIAEEYLPDLIITVDCGITAKEDIEYTIEELGIDVIVTDHHEPPQELPNCIIVNPKVDRCENTFNELCGAGVVLRLVEAIGGRERMMMFIDIAAIATIGDIVPLTSDNRAIVQYGLKVLNSRARLAIKLLLEEAGVGNEVLNSADVAYKIVPKINAIGRLSDSIKAVSLFTDDDYFYVKGLVKQAGDFNRERQQLTDDLINDCLEKLENYNLSENRAIVLYSDKWETGVLGIACSHLVSIFQRPVILFTESMGVYKGSCRSIDGVNLFQALKACSSFLLSYGGHAMACGVSAEKENLEGFVFALNEYLNQFEQNLFLPHCVYDIKKDLGEINVEYIEKLEVLQPYGMGNPSVSFLIEDNNISFSQIGESKHIKFKKNEECEIIAFNNLQNMRTFNGLDKKEVIAEFSNKIFANRKYAQGIIREMVIDGERGILDSKYYAVKHLYQCKFPDKTIFDIKPIAFNEAFKYLEQGIYGICFLCYNIDTYRGFIDLANEKVIKRDISRLSDVNSFNRIVLDLDLNENLVYYKKIVFLDKPVSLGIIDYLKLNRNCEIEYVESEGYNSNMQIVKDSFPDIENMRAIYINIKSLIEKKKYSNVAELYEDFRKKFAQTDTVGYYVAIYVFFELKLIICKRYLEINKDIKTSLENSVIYTKIRSAISG